MIRILLLLVMVSLGARASDAILPPAQGVSESVTQPHVTADLIPETTTVEAGKPFDVILHLKSDEGWHTYWINPGDAGLATTIDWTLPSGFTAGAIQWPTPEKHDMGGLMTYGYAGDVYLITTITPPKTDLPQHFEIKAKARWLVCKEECIPGKADLSLTYDSGMLNLRLPINNSDFFKQARERVPVANTRWDVAAAYMKSDGGNGQPPPQMAIDFTEKANSLGGEVKGATFFPEQPNVLATQNQKGWAKSAESAKKFELLIDLQQNGEKPDKLSGVLVSDQPLIGNAKAVYITEFPVSQVAAAVPGGGSTAPTNSAPAQGPRTPVAPSTSETPPSHDGGNGAPAATAQPLLIGVLGAAFVGGLILNLMPCVLPVLSLKVFSLMKHAGENPKAAWVQGVAFTAGVVLSFWALAGLLLLLRSAGNHLGWGFQMQSPNFVLALIFLFFLLALNLFGVFELGTSLVGLDAKATNHLGGLASSFGNGALATLAATPCTAPFMGSALGFAAQQPAYVSMLIFTVLALGMAAPYLLLTIFPGALRFVPKPGAWMEAFKQFMGFLLMATVIFLVYVFSKLTSEESLPMLLFVLLVTGLAAWIYGKWGSPLHSTVVRSVAILLTIGLLGGSIAFGVTLTDPKLRGLADARVQDGWQPWTQTAVDDALAKGQPVFVDFTAAWCLSCKVNERVALDTDAVKKAFTDKNVALFLADWTHSDPEISKTLQKYNRDGVPLYLLYSPKAKDQPQVLPAVLTPGIVLDAVKNL